MLPRTPSQTVGPFFSFGLCDGPANELIDSGAPAAIRLSGRLFDGAGPVNDGLVEVWHPDAGFGRCGTDEEGRFELVVVKPRGAEAAPHLNVMVFARGLLKQVVTRIYFPDEQEANARDPWLSSLTERDRSTLVAAAKDSELRFDVNLQGERETVFLAF